MRPAELEQTHTVAPDGLGAAATDTVLPDAVPAAAHPTGLPADLLVQSAGRLRVVVLLYAFAFFMSDPFGAILLPEERAAFLATPLRWLPSTISIGLALVVAALVSNRRVPVMTMLRAGLAFEVIASFGIAMAQYYDASRWLPDAPRGLSWVAVWVLSFTIIIPTAPRQAMAFALLSASSVPLVAGAALLGGLAATPVTPAEFAFFFVIPYLLIVLIAGVGARIIHGLGTEITKARQLGSYQLVRRLGQGGMGEVWLARHRLLARPAAIKLMRPEVLGGSTPERHVQLRVRFEREAQATALLRSPHTIELYDFGVADDGSFYYVMELLDGFDLDSLVRRFGPVSADRAVHLLRQMCESLGEAHASGLVHRDIKPANVYVCRYGREVDFVKVLDFGLVKSQSQAIDDEPIPTLTGVDVAGGTPAFMSPEQVLSNRPLDGRSDIYAVGCVAYWLLTGELVFTGRTAMETMLKHTEETPIPVSARTELPVPPELDALILECLAKRPEDRPSSADALIARLEAIAQGTWSGGRAREWWDTHSPADAADAGRGAK